MVKETVRFPQLSEILSFSESEIHYLHIISIYCKIKATLTFGILLLQLSTIQDDQSLTSRVLRFPNEVIVSKYLPDKFYIYLS